MQVNAPRARGFEASRGRSQVVGQVAGQGPVILGKQALIGLLLVGLLLVGLPRGGAVFR